MKFVQLTKHHGQFRPVTTTRRAQVAIMELRAGAASDEELSNEHPRCEQWLYVVNGTGTATIVPKRGRRRHLTLRPRSLLIIEQGERHQIRNTGRKLLSTVNFYLPPAYYKSGELLPTAKR